MNPLKSYRSIFRLGLLALAMLSASAYFSQPRAEGVPPQQEDMLRKQITGCWSSVKVPDPQIVVIDLEMNRDRTIHNAEVEDKDRYEKDAAYKQSADGAIGALNSPACHKLDLPQDQYDVWKHFVVTFDPKNLLGAQR